jgi:excisionase family DNA binding protein
MEDRRRNRRHVPGEGFNPRAEYTVTEAARLMGLARETVHRACREGRLPCRAVPYGKRTVRWIRGADVEDYAAQGRIPRRFFRKPVEEIAA